MSAVAAFDHARKRLRAKLGLPAAAANGANEEPFDTTSAATPLTSVLHRVLEFEDKKQDPELLPLPEALTHSPSGSWRQLVLDTGKPAWQLDERQTPSGEAVKGIVKPHAQSSQNAIVSHAQGGSNNTAQQDRKQSADLTASSELLLQLPEVHTMQQARQQVDHLQQQAYFKTRKLQEAKFLARQAAEQLLACQLRAPHPGGQESDAAEMETMSQPNAKETQALQAAQAHMLSVSEQVSVAELATELAEARACFLERAAGNLARTQQDSSSTAQSSSQQGSSWSGPSDPGSASEPISANLKSAPAASVSTVGSALPGGGLSALRLVLDRPYQVAGLQHLSSVLNPGLSVTPASEPGTQSNEVFDNCLSAPATPSPDASSNPRMYSPVGARSVGHSSVHSSDSAQPVCSDSSASTATSAHEPHDCESTSGQSPSVPDALPADDHAECAIPSDLPPLPPLPVSGDQGSAAQGEVRSRSSSKYVHVGCAIACLCVFALWAKSASVISFTSRIFPT